ncbi:hypothetical protein [Catellatospora methionotrophica]|uniref:hypothetical protein n=1 Tax=Catellatospora methionotrophica TaxID=121620 RepID=UPI0033D634A8
MARRFEVTWTEISQHSYPMTSSELAEVLGITTAELKAMTAAEVRDACTEDAADNLSEYSGAGFDGVVREDIQITVIHTSSRRRTARPADDEPLKTRVDDDPALTARP